MSEVTRVIQAIGDGDPQAADRLLPLVYEELRKLAASKMARETPGQTLQPTALVHEAWLRVTDGSSQKWDNRGHFFAAAAEAMRRILIDNARRKRAVRHGGQHQRVDLDCIEVPEIAEEDELLKINDALEKFATRDPQKAELVKLRYFVSLEEAAEVLGLSVPTAKRHWTYARAWLYRELSTSP